jgi:hypothetical protein
MSGVGSKKSGTKSEGISLAVELLRLGLRAIKDPPPPLVLPKEPPPVRR